MDDPFADPQAKKTAGHEGRRFRLHRRGPRARSDYMFSIKTYFNNKNRYISESLSPFSSFLAPNMAPCS